MSVFMDELFDELVMTEVNFTLQSIADQLKDALAEDQADLLFFDNYLSFTEGT